MVELDQCGRSAGSHSDQVRPSSSPKSTSLSLLSGHARIPISSPRSEARHRSEVQIPANDRASIVCHCARLLPSPVAQWDVRPSTEATRLAPGSGPMPYQVQVLPGPPRPRHQLRGHQGGAVTSRAISASCSTAPRTSPVSPGFASREPAQGHPHHCSHPGEDGGPPPHRHQCDPEHRQDPGRCAAFPRVAITRPETVGRGRRQEAITPTLAPRLSA